MKLGLRIFACYLVIFCICFAFPVGWVLDTLRTRYLEGVEDPLVDQAHILAGVVGQMMAADRFDPEAFYQTFEAIYQRRAVKAFDPDHRLSADEERKLLLDRARTGGRGGRPGGRDLAILGRRPGRPRA